VVAGRAVSEAAASSAVIEKMLRVMMLAPFLVILSSRVEHDDASARRITIPWFALLFILAAGVNSLHLLPAGLVAALLQLDTVLLAMAMAALGLRTHVGAVKHAGVKPILLASVLFVFLVVGGYVINRFVTAII
jgi:uncharacterized integral membrane protein (TIGR00698 family)